MSTYLLDTCTISDLFSDVGKVQKRLQAMPPARVSISVVTVMEILYGFALNPSAKRRFSKAFDSLTSVARVIPFDRQSADVAASIRAQLKTRGTPIGAWDLLIGATAVAHGCTLVTSNTREFEGIDSLRLEDWR